MSEFGLRMHTPRDAWSVWLLGTLALGACELAPVEIPGGERLVVVTAVMRPDLPYQFVVVGQTLEGTTVATDSMEFPIPPHGPHYPITDAVVEVTNLDLASDSCGSPVAFVATPSDPEVTEAAGVYWAPQWCPAMRPGDRLQIQVEAAGAMVTGVTRVPGMNEAYVVRGPDSLVLGGGDSLLTINRDRDTLQLGVDAVAGRLLQLDVRRDGDLSDYGTRLQVDTTAFELAGNAVNVYVSGNGNDVFCGGRIYRMTLTLSDTNYFDFSRSSNNEFTGRGFLNRLEGGLGVFGSAMSVTSRVWVVADMDNPREGVYHLTGTVGDTAPVSVDAQLRVYLQRDAEVSDFSAFLDGDYFTRGTGHFGSPPFLPRTVTGMSVDGTAFVNRLHLAVPDTLEGNARWYTTLEWVVGDTDSIEVTVGDSTLQGSFSIGTLLAVRAGSP